MLPPHPPHPISFSSTFLLFLLLFRLFPTPPSQSPVMQLSVCVYTSFPASGLSAPLLFSSSVFSSHHHGSQASHNPPLFPFFLFISLSLFFSVSLAVSGSQLWTSEVTVFPYGKHFYGAWGRTSTWPEGVPTALFYFLWNCEMNSGIPGILKLLSSPEV